MTEDLVAWLLDQIDEDERMAQDEVEARARWQAEYAAAGPIGIVVNPFDEPGSPGDPARVLAECDAKRRIIEAHKPNETLAQRRNRCPAGLPGLRHGIRLVRMRRLGRMAM